MISVKNLSKRFHSHTAVDNISFQVGKGQTLALLGTSGCGKTTTLRMLNRLTEPDSGDIIINGQSVSSVSPDLLRRGIGYVLQSIGLLPHYTIARNIAIVPELLGWEKDRIQERTLSLLQKLHLPEAYLNSYPHELSGGQQQRVGIARALAADPPLLLMDEPFSALDPLTRTAIRQDFKDLDELKDKTIVLVTHDVNEAVELADVICLMDKGAIVQTGTPKELLFSPANEFATRFFAEQKLLLQYKSVSLAELWPFFSADSISTSGDAVSIKTVFDAFSLLHSEGRQSITVFNETEHTHKTIDAESLGKAFVHYKQALAK